MTKRKVETKGFSAPISRKVPPNTKTRCPKCGRQVESLRCGHCGSRLPAEQASLYGAVITKLAKLGGYRADAGKKGGGKDANSNRSDFPTSKRQRRNPHHAIGHNGTKAQQVAQQQGDLKPEDFEALLTFVQAVGGWLRAKWVFEEGHKKCQQNQNG